MNNSAIIKWSGSKRAQAPQILDNFPKEIDTYYEPFLGSGAVLFELLSRIKSGEIKCNKIIVNDINSDLMNLWDFIYNKPNTLLDYYKKNYDIISSFDNMQQQMDFYYSERDKFNENRNPEIFYWLTRTCYNGLVRYNSSSKYNSPFHLNRIGMIPSKLEKIFDSWIELFSQDIDIEFKCIDYKKLLEDLKENDFIYFDPPYENTNGLMYFHNGFNNDEFIEELQKIAENKIHFALLYDGKHGKDDITSTNIPDSIYKKHIYIYSGNSSFSRLNKENREVYESLYIN